MSDEIFYKLKKIMHEIKPHENVKLEHTFKEDLEYDSLDTITLYFDTEKAFNIEMPESDLSQYELTTVKQFIDYIQGKLA
jgi:acyl carrier protein